MEESTHNATSTQEQTLTRREALKTLVAITGAATLASLPKHWESPLIEVGTLPAHAQGSGLMIPEVLGFGNPETSEGAGLFAYFDGAGQVDDSASLLATIESCGEIVFDGPLSAVLNSGGIILGTPSEGLVGFLFNSTTRFCNVSQPELCIELEAAGRSASNCGPMILNINIPLDLDDLTLNLL